jgi:hypothetical protein
MATRSHQQFHSSVYACVHHCYLPVEQGTSKEVGFLQYRLKNNIGHRRYLMDSVGLEFL